MKTNLTISIDVELLKKVRRKIKKGNISERIEELLKKELGVD